MAKINESIPKQNFEIVRDVISAILKTELENQKILQNFDDEIDVYTGRSTPFQSSELLMINCLVDSSDFSSKHQQGVHGKVNYFIDIYCSSAEKENQDGGYLSTEKRDKFLGMIRYILDHHFYITLGLPSGFIMGTSVEGFENFETPNQNDAAFVKMSRLTFGVRMTENQSLWSGVNIAGIFTDVKLDLTNKGYKYEKIIN